MSNLGLSSESTFRYTVQHHNPEFCVVQMLVLKCKTLNHNLGFLLLNNIIMHLILLLDI